MNAKYSALCTFSDEVKYCDIVFDSFLCWGPTRAGKTAHQYCPPARLSDTSRLAFRLCDETGKWAGRRPNDSSPIGWTNYTPCFPLEVKTLFDKVSEDEYAQAKFEIAQRTRYLEIVGFSLSLVALIISLFIFSYYRSLHNSRTKIHKCLFWAMTTQVIVRLVLYIDQVFARSVDQGMNVNTVRGIDNMPYLCEISYALLEYAITVMFMWMFIEGLYLNNLVTKNVFREKISYLSYFMLGWVLPLVVVVIWAIITAIHYKREEVKQCWYGYNFLSIYWIVQGPRLAVVIVNMIFLLNILKVLVLKLRRSENSEVNKVRKAVRAAFVLLPLLGITNALDMTETPLSGQVWVFALWSYITHFLRSFQGFFIALIYCFLNAEVRVVLRKHYDNYKAMRETRRRNASLFRNNGRSHPIRPKMRNRATQTKPIKRQMMMHWNRSPHTPRTLHDIQMSLPEQSPDGQRRSTSTSTGPVVYGYRRPSTSVMSAASISLEMETRNIDYYTRRSNRPSTSYGRYEETST